MFGRSKPAKQKPLTREPSRATAAYDRGPTQPMRPMSRPLNDSRGTPTAVEPNTLVVAVDFGKYPFHFRLQANFWRRMLIRTDRNDVYWYTPPSFHI